MVENAENTTDVESEETSERSEPALGLSDTAAAPKSPEGVLDAEFDDVSQSVTAEDSQASLSKTSAPLQDRPVPRISIEAFCKSPENGSVMQQVASDRRLSRAHVTVHMGGIEAAVQHFSVTPTPNLVLVETGLDHQEIFAGLEELASVCDAGTKVIVIGQVNDIILYRELIRQGVSEYLVGPLTVPQVIDSISTLYVDPGATPIGRSLVFTGAKGGVGSSTLAHNVSWCIAERLAHDVTLIDLDLPFGTAGLDFNEDPTQGVADALIAPERLDDQLLDRLLVKCSEHLSLFTSPGVLDRDFDLDSEAFESVLDTVRATVPCMVVDLPHIWVPWTRHILLTADEIVITATPDLASLRNAKNLVELLKQTRENDNLPMLVLNQTGVTKRPEISEKDFAEAVGVPVVLSVPFEPQLFGTAANNGQMVAEMKPEARVTQAMITLAGQLTQREAVEQKVSPVQKFLTQLKGK